SRQSYIRCFDAQRGSLWSKRIPMHAVEWSKSLRQKGARGLSKTLRHGRTRLPFSANTPYEVIHEYARQHEESVKKARHAFGPVDSCHGSSCLGDAPNTAWNGHGIWRRSSGSMLFRFPTERHTTNAWSGLPFTASIGYI
ncbi:hypothetical protein CH063_06185, partial [Colletotrichum higginsianum]